MLRRVAAVLTIFAVCAFAGVGVGAALALRQGAAVEVAVRLGPAEVAARFNQGEPARLKLRLAAGIFDG